MERGESAAKGLSASLARHGVLFGMNFRDASLIDIELMAGAGYHVVWFDMEHGPQPMARILELTRSVIHLGMIPMVRIPELSRSHVQPLLDGGVEILCLPEVETKAEVSELVRLGRYPPVGQRGGATATAALDYQRPAGIDEVIDAEDRVRLMAMIESDAAYENLDEFLAIDGLDMIGIGKLDWALSRRGRDGEVEEIDRRVDHILTSAKAAGKITVMTPTDEEQARHYRELGVQIFVLGGDVDLKRRHLEDRLDHFTSALSDATG